MQVLEIFFRVFKVGHLPKEAADGSMVLGARLALAATRWILLLPAGVSTAKSSRNTGGSPWDTQDSVGYIHSTISGAGCQGGVSLVTALKTVTGHCRDCVYPLCLERKAKCCTGLEETASDLQDFETNSSRQWWGVGKGALVRFLRRILVFCCLTWWNDPPCSCRCIEKLQWLKL